MARRKSTPKSSAAGLRRSKAHAANRRRTETLLYPGSQATFVGMSGGRRVTGISIAHVGSPGRKVGKTMTVQATGVRNRPASVKITNPKPASRGQVIREARRRRVSTGRIGIGGGSYRGPRPLEGAATSRSAVARTASPYARRSSRGRAQAQRFKTEAYRGRAGRARRITRRGWSSGLHPRGAGGRFIKK